MNQSISKITQNNFTVFKDYINECIKYFSSFTFIHNLDIELNTYQDLVLYLQTTEIYLCSKNNKNIGIFSTRVNEYDLSVSYSFLSHPKVCKMSVLNLNDLAFNHVLSEYSQTHSYVSAFVYHSMLLKPFKEKGNSQFLKLSDTFWLAKTPLKQGEQVV